MWYVCIPILQTSQKWPTRTKQQDENAKHALCSQKAWGLSGFLIRRSSARLKQLVRNYVLIPWLALLHGRFLATVAILMFRYTVAYIYIYTKYIYIDIYKHLELVFRGPTKTIAREDQIMVAVFRHVYIYIFTLSGSSPNATTNLSFSQVFLIALKFTKDNTHSFQAACHHSVPAVFVDQMNDQFGWWSSRSFSCIGDTDRQYQCGCFQK